MPRDGCALVPIRSFDGMTRLAGRLSAVDRRELSCFLALRVVEAARAGGFTPIVVTGDNSVSEWATDRQVESFAEPIPGGLNRAAAAAVEAVNGHPWIVVHADLPAVTAEDFRSAADALDRGIVLAPSHDGGTPLVGGSGDSFPFRYGPGSFRAHLAAVRGRASILIRPGLALDLDRPWDFTALTDLGYLSRDLA